MNAETKKTQPSTEEMEKKTRTNILGLDQKLRGLRAEIEAKIKGVSVSKEEVSAEYMDGLTHLLGEVDLAIEGIDIVVTTVMADDEELKNSFLQSDDAQHFNQMLTESLDKIKKMKKDF